MDALVRTQESPLHATDRLMFTFWGLLSLVFLVLHSRLQFWWVFPAANIAAIVLVWALARASQGTGFKVLRWTHDWAAFPLVIFTYKQVYYLIRVIHQGKDYDQLLIAMDRALLRVNPTEWLAHFSNPCMTEVLQIAYSLFYAIFLIVGLELYCGRDSSRYRHFCFTIVYGFFLSYIGNLSLPAVGPRFTLHDFSKIGTDLPGLLLTPALRWFVNIFESIRLGMSSSVALAAAQRDVFPSGHTMMTLLSIAIAYRYKTKVRTAMLVLGILLIFATVYLRYHYVVDILAGALLAVFCLLTANKVYGVFKGGGDNTLENPAGQAPRNSSVDSA
jgi:membrane-associated phospholipid phosphatase